MTNVRKPPARTGGPQESHHPAHKATGAESATTDSYSAGQRPLHVATVTRKDRKLHRLDVTSWADVVAAVREPLVADKEAGGLVFYGQLDATRRREGSHVLGRSLLVLDADHSTLADLPDRVARLGCAAVVYATHSHTPEAPRFRVLVLPDRNLTPAEYPLASLALMHKLGGVAQWDRGASATVQQGIFAPATADPEEYARQLAIVDGPPVQVDDLLELCDVLGLAHGLAEAGAEDATPGAPYDGPAYADMTPDRQRRIDAYVEATEARWAKTLADAEEWPDGETDEQGRGWEALVRDAVLSFAGHGVATWAPGTVADARARFFDVLPEAMAADEKCAAETKWRRAVRKAKQKPLPPPAGPEDDFGPLAPEPEPEPVEPMALSDAEAVFHRWLGAEYDMDALRIVLAAVAVDRLDGDPLWVLVLSGPGNAKTETVQALSPVATITSTIASEGALLSATSRRERSKDATGGLLRQMGAHGVLVVKDVTSILSMNANMRAGVLAALREVYDGYWQRNVGTDGGRQLTWRGRLAVIGAVTSAWDTAHSVISTMGDRFVLLRVDSGKGRQAAGKQAIANTGHETAMRAELADAVARVLAGMDDRAVKLTEAEQRMILRASDLVTRARTAVQVDYRGDVIDADMPEAPTRFAKQLAQVLRGACAVGMDRDDALRLAIRAARDSVPPLRLAIIDDLAEHGLSSTQEVRKRLNKPRATVDRQLQALHMLGILHCAEVTRGEAGGISWIYDLSEDVHPDSLKVPGEEVA